jgi:hypothetical protein
MTDPGSDPSPRVERWDERIEQWMEDLRAEVERAAPEVLGELAAAAKNIAGRLDDLAEQARKKQATEGASAEIDQPPGDKLPPVSS